MARMPLPPTHRVQWEDEPGGDKVGKRKGDRERRLVSFRRSLLPVWLFAKEVGGEMQESIILRNTLMRDHLWQPHWKSYSVWLRRSFEGNDGERGIHAHTQLWCCERCGRVLVILLKHDKKPFSLGDISEISEGRSHLSVYHTVGMIIWTSCDLLPCEGMFQFSPTFQPSLSLKLQTQLHLDFSWEC